MGCDVFNAAQGGAQFFDANLNAGCFMAASCGENCLILDPSGHTSRKKALEIVEDVILGKLGEQKVEKFYKILERRRLVPAVMQAQARAGARALAEIETQG
ncbi:MAG: hypothetical protein AAB580_01590 [Patescibacteria group bacterium]